MCHFMKGHSFVLKVRLLDLGEYNMVLGVDWMKSYSPVSFDYNNCMVSVKKDGKQMDLMGATEEGTLKLMSTKKLQKLFKKKWTGMCAQFFSLHCVAFNDESVTNSDNVPLAIQSLLDENAHIF